MHPEEFLQRQKERNEKKRRRILTTCIVVCVIWVPIALFLYQPALLFEKEVQQEIQQDNVPDG